MSQWKWKQKIGGFRYLLILCIGIFLGILSGRFYNGGGFKRNETKQQTELVQIGTKTIAFSYPITKQKYSWKNVFKNSSISFLTFFTALLIFHVIIKSRVLSGSLFFLLGFLNGFFLEELAVFFGISGIFYGILTLPIQYILPAFFYGALCEQEKGIRNKENLLRIRIKYGMVVLAIEIAFLFLVSLLLGFLQWKLLTNMISYRIDESLGCLPTKTGIGNRLSINMFADFLTTLF